jgi:hypothetical protein
MISVWVYIWQKSKTIFQFIGANDVIQYLNFTNLFSRIDISNFKPFVYSTDTQCMLINCKYNIFLWNKFVSFSWDHRVGRVLSFFSSRRNWDSPNPSPAGEYAPPPFGTGGRGTLAGERGGGRVPIATRGHTLWYSLYTYFVPEMEVSCWATVVGFC